MGMTTIKINDATFKRIKNHLAISGQTITAFIDIAVSHEFEKIHKEKLILSSYAESMAPILGKSINATRKNKRK